MDLPGWHSGLAGSSNCSKEHRGLRVLRVLLNEFVSGRPPPSPLTVAPVHIISNCAPAQLLVCHTGLRNGDGCNCYSLTQPLGPDRVAFKVRWKVYFFPLPHLFGNFHG